MRQRVGAPGQGSAHKMAAAVTFCRLLGRSGKAALSLPRGARCLAVRTSPTGEKITHTGQVTAAAGRPLSISAPRASAAYGRGTRWPVGWVPGEAAGLPRVSQGESCAGSGSG